MQEIELALIVAAILTVVVVLAIRTRTHPNERSLRVGAALGIVPGVLGAIIVLVPRTDLIPDGVEPLLWVLVGIVGTVIALVALTVGLARR